MTFPVRLSLTTYNLWGTERWPEREPALRLFCELYRPDILCVQELTAETMAVLDDALPGHGRVQDDMAGWTTEGNIWWDEAILEPIAHGADEFGIVAYPERRLFWVRLQVRESDETLFVSTVHLTDPGTPEELGEGRNNRIVETKHIIELLAGHLRPGEAGFLLGDLNDALAPLAHFLLAGYTSCFAALGQLPPPTMPAFTNRLHRGFTSNFVLDWILANGNALAMAASSPHVYAGDVAPSDHWPVHAVYELRARHDEESGLVDDASTNLESEVGEVRDEGDAPPA